MNLINIRWKKPDANKYMLYDSTYKKFKNKSSYIIEEKPS